MARLRWTPQALEDVEAICTYIARDSNYYARMFASQIIDKASTLELFPKAGRIVPESNREDVEQWRICFEVGARNRLLGHEPTSIGQLVKYACTRSTG